VLVRRWVNIAPMNDTVAARGDHTRRFPDAYPHDPVRRVEMTDVPVRVDNGSVSPACVRYLAKKVCAYRVEKALTGSR
jgi:hypothetical protein